MGVSEVRIGAGSGFAGDRIDPAVALVERADLDYLVFECLGERTIAAANARRLTGSGPAYDLLLQRRFEATLDLALKRGTRIVTNGGAADPDLAARMVHGIAGGAARVATITGDDVLDLVREHDPLVWEDGLPVSQQAGRLVSANAYLGAEPVVEALAEGADVVIGGRLADPSLYLGPMAHHFGWDLGSEQPRARQLLGQGTVIAHLLECAGQLTGGYHADPVTHPVPAMATLGFPFADVSADGSATLGKLSDTGGVLTPRTVTAQLLYEVGDPAAYLTPDITADFTGVSFAQTRPDRVAVTGGQGRARPNTLKITLGFAGSWSGEGQISYAGPRALERAKLAAEVVVERLQVVHAIPGESLSVEYIGTGSAHRGLVAVGEAPEVRLRVAGVVPSERAAHAIGWEVESLYTNGPGGGGGARTSQGPTLSIRSTDLSREMITPQVRCGETA